MRSISSATNCDIAGKMAVRLYFLIYFLQFLTHVHTNLEEGFRRLGDRLAELEERGNEQQNEIRELNTKLDRQARAFNGKLKGMAVRFQKEKEELISQVVKLNANVNEINDYRETLLRKGRASSVRPEVAFFASVSKDVQLGPGQVVVFNSVITNIDSTSHVLPYDGNTGVFTAPLDGLYVFSATVLSEKHASGHFFICKDNSILSTMYVHGSEGSTWDSASNTVVVSLLRGQTVSVRDWDAHALDGALLAGQSIFSGFLLQDHSLGNINIAVIG
ncbi:uncharacterized protein LOC127862541 isoform X2 [Dreissena polymorpha]|uniref:uncharacterized protein LOC127862541 isoform X2 n=1 Tax=Dreissena polymorpha TaxID=45954 RepID=UPI00226501B0|nr:uncharacterized protein LOC127862541 isoform X2 [Dreissena polymorpha]